MTKGATSDATFHYYIDRWQLIVEGNPLVTRTSRLLPVRWQGMSAVLKVAVEPEEELGNELMAASTHQRGSHRRFRDQRPIGPADAGPYLYCQPGWHVGVAPAWMGGQGTEP